MIVTVEQDRNQKKAAYYKRTIKCPGHWLIPPTVDVYLRKPIALFKNCSDFVYLLGRKIKLKKTRIVHDRFGNKMVDWKKLYALRDKGKIIQGKVSAAWAIEHVYDPMSTLCDNCPKYCKEGQGRVMTGTINRLNGKKMKR